MKYEKFHILLILSILSITLVSSYSEEVCNEAFYFLVESEGNYLQEDVGSVLQSLNLTNEEKLLFLDNYTSECEALVGKSLPYEKVRELGPDSQYPVCNTGLELTPLGYKMDLSLPSPDVFLRERTCSQVEKLRWIFRLESNHRNLYSITGVKVWFILATIVTLYLTKFLFSNLRINKIIKDTHQENKKERFIKFGGHRER